jgi:hypothetical protein
MDNCPAHLIDEMMSLLIEASLRVIAFAPYTTQIFQVLDLTLSRILRRCPRYELSFRDDKATIELTI